MSDEFGATYKDVIRLRVKLNCECEGCALKMKKAAKKVKGVSGATFEDRYSIMKVLGDFDENNLIEALAAKSKNPVEKISYDGLPRPGKSFGASKGKEKAAPSSAKKDVDVAKVNEKMKGVTISEGGEKMKTKGVTISEGGERMKMKGVTISENKESEEKTKTKTKKL